MPSREQQLEFTAMPAVPAWSAPCAIRAWNDVTADRAGKLKKPTRTNLYSERPAWLELAHRKLAAAVAAVCGWLAELTDEQILERLLTLNARLSKQGSRR